PARHRAAPQRHPGRPAAAARQCRSAQAPADQVMTSKEAIYARARAALARYDANHGTTTKLTGTLVPPTRLALAAAQGITELIRGRMHGRLHLDVELLSGPVASCPGSQLVAKLTGPRGTVRLWADPTGTLRMTGNLKLAAPEEAALYVGGR